MCNNGYAQCAINRVFSMTKSLTKVFFMGFLAAGGTLKAPLEQEELSYDYKQEMEYRSINSGLIDGFVESEWRENRLSSSGKEKEYKSSPWSDGQRYVPNYAEYICLKSVCTNIVGYSYQWWQDIKPFCSSCAIELGVDHWDGQVDDEKPMPKDLWNWNLLYNQIKAEEKKALIAKERKAQEERSKAEGIRSSEKKSRREGKSKKSSRGG